MVDNLVGIKELPPGRGFSYDSRPPKLDRLAVECANEIFGYSKVTKIFQQWHRPSPSLDLLRDGILKYGTPSKPRVDDDVYRMVFAEVKEMYRSPELIIPLTLGAVAKHPDFPGNKSPGFPYIMSNEITTKSDAYATDFRNIHRIWDMIGKGHHVKLPDSAAYQRLQISPEGKDKVRPVWGYPTSVILEEGRFFYPQLDWIENRTDDHPYAIGLEMANGGMQYVNQMANKDPNSTYALVDYSSFDTSPPGWLVRDAFEILSQNYDFSRVQDSEGKIWYVNREQSIRRFSKCISYFINTPVQMPNGERYLKSKGVPSGSMFTNLIDSIINMLVTKYVAYECTGKRLVRDLYMGDDVVACLQGIVNLEDWANVARSVFGMVINMDKSYVTTNPSRIQFLGYYNNNGVPERDSSMLVASFIFPERTVTKAVDTITRAVGQMYSTLNPKKAYIWYSIIKAVYNKTNVSYNEMHSYIKDYPGRFKYLMTLGYDLSDIVYSPRFDNSLGLIHHIAPKVQPTRLFRRG